jgi:hypothetical protein
MCSFNYPACKAHAPYYTGSYGLSGSTTFFYIVPQTARFSEILLNTKRFDFLYQFFLQYFSFQEELSEILPYVYTGIHVKYPLFLTDFNET